ncbi:hypothetical protein [Streptomyces flavidovirens]|uniref:hypothetical protein n=1 Tax=Streptomyces flavidovirens TaxID=67298 RepID=UPI00040A9A72
MSTTILDARTLLPEETYKSVRRTILDANPDMAEDTAGRITDESIKFVVACAKNPGVGMAPSRIVDDGWHALLLHSAAYAKLCDQFGGWSTTTPAGTRRTTTRRPSTARVR